MKAYYRLNHFSASYCRHRTQPHNPSGLEVLSVWLRSIGAEKRGLLRNLVVHDRSVFCQHFKGGNCRHCPTYLQLDKPGPFVDATLEELMEMEESGVYRVTFPRVG